MMIKPSRQSLIVRLGQAIQKLPLAWMRVGETRLVRRRSPQNRLRMIILLALPRSGSTLTYQTMIHSIQSVYLSNLGNVLYHLPFWGGRISQWACPCHESDFQSHEGFVSGLNGPAEGLQFWHYWLGSGLDDRNEKHIHPTVQQRRVHYLREVIGELSQEHAPFITGFLGHTLMPDEVQRTFPEAVVVRLWRDPVSNAESILKCRRAAKGTWFSLFPRECAEILLEDEYRQVAAQVYWLNRRLDHACSGTNALWINYETMCENPTREMNRLKDFCQTQGLELRDRHPLPGQFRDQSANRKRSADAAALADAIRELEKEHGDLYRMSSRDADSQPLTSAA